MYLQWCKSYLRNKATPEMIQFVCLWISVKVETQVIRSAGQEDAQGEAEKAETENDTPTQTTEKTSPPTGFTVLGGFENKPVQKVHWFVNDDGGWRVRGHQYHVYSSTVCVFFCSQVHRVLPQWLAQPDMIHRDIKSNLVPFSDMPGLSSHLMKKLQNNGIKHLFPGNDTTSSYSVCSKSSEFWKWLIWTIMSSRLEICLSPLYTPWKVIVFNIICRVPMASWIVGSFWIWGKEIKSLCCAKIEI